MRYVLAMAAAFFLGGVCETPAASTDSGRNSVDALYNAGIRLLESGDPDAALARFTEALGINKKHAPSLVGAGLVYLQRGDLDAACRKSGDALDSVLCLFAAKAAAAGQAPVAGDWASITQS